VIVSGILIDPKYRTAWDEISQDQNFNNKLDAFRKRIGRERLKNNAYPATFKLSSGTICKISISASDDFELIVHKITFL